MTTMTEDRKLGKNQREFLQLFRQHRGIWHRGSKWCWKAPSETVRLLESLERRGYAAQDSQGRWIMTPEGRSAVRRVTQG